VSRLNAGLGAGAAFGELVTVVGPAGTGPPGGLDDSRQPGDSLRSGGGTHPRKSFSLFWFFNTGGLATRPAQVAQAGQGVVGLTGKPARNSATTVAMIPIA